MGPIQFPTRNPHQIGTTGSRRKAALAAGLVLAVLLAVADAGLFGAASGPLETRPAQETIGWPFHGFFGSAASAVMYRLGIPAKSSDPGPIEVHWSDGPDPEEFWTSFSSKASFEEITEFYEASCKKLGLKVLPPESALAREADFYCDGRYKGGIASVFLRVNCAQDLCDVFLRVLATR